MPDKYLNLEGELLELSKEHDKLKDEIEKLKYQKSELRTKIIKIMELEKISKARSQKLTVSLSVIVPNPRLSQKKLKEEMVANNLEEMWNNCLYVPDPYKKLVIKKRKHGENIF